MDGTQQPAIFGEVLYDVFDDEHTVLGGAPFNVAWHLQGFGLSPSFISRIGRDAHGENIIKTMQAWGMNQDGIQFDKEHATGTVSVSITKGQPSYDIVADVAYDHLKPVAVEQLMHTDKLPILYHGSLIARTKQTHDVLSALREKAASIFVDINLRDPWWDHELIFSLIEGATWLKVNDEELALLMSIDNHFIGLENAAINLLSRYALEGIIVTRGEQGALFVSTNGVFHAKPVMVSNIQDTVGAGDAYSAVCMIGFMNNWDYQLMLDRAAIFAGAICQQRGATSSNIALYEEYIKQWKLG